MRAWPGVLLVLLIGAWAPCSGDGEKTADGSGEPFVTVTWNGGTMEKPVGPQTVPFDFSGTGNDGACKKAGKTCPTHRKCESGCSACYGKGIWDCARCNKNPNGLDLRPPKDEWKKEYSPRGRCQTEVPVSAASLPVMTCTSFGFNSDYSCMKNGVASAQLQHTKTTGGKVFIVVYAAVSKYISCKRKVGSQCPTKAGSDHRLGEETTKKRPRQKPKPKPKATKATKSASRVTKSARKAVSAATRAVAIDKATCKKPRQGAQRCHKCSVTKRGWCQQLCFVINGPFPQHGSASKCKGRGVKKYKYHAKVWPFSVRSHALMCCFKDCQLDSAAQRAFPFMKDVQQQCENGGGWRDPAGPAIAAF